MANSATLIKNGISEVVYRFVNDSATPQTMTVTLSSLARADQAIVGTPIVGISNLSFNADSGSNIKVLRNSVLQYFLTGTGEHTAAYATDYQNSTSDVVVTMGAGTLVMRMSKGSEYVQSA